MDLETLGVLRTRLTLRLQEAHRRNEKQDDINVGKRIGIYAALKIVEQTIDDAIKEVR